MNDGKREIFVDYFYNSFKAILKEMTNMDVHKTDPIQARDFGDKAVSVIIGTVGENRGRIVLQICGHGANDITEGMNGEPVVDDEERFSYLGEFANTFCGNAITKINNHFQKNLLRLTPPAVFSGAGLSITTPKIKSEKFYFSSNNRMILMDVGFEGE